MIAKEVMEIASGMEVSEATKTKINQILEKYKPTDEVEEMVVDQILKLIDSEFDPNKLVEEEQDLDKIDINK